VKSRPVNADSERVNACRSLCKDFWRDLFLLMDTCDEFGDNKLRTWHNRHQRFVDQVQRLDVLKGYEHDGAKDYVYIPHKRFPKSAK
jgi:hypothetical protein